MCADILSKLSSSVSYSSTNLSSETQSFIDAKHAESVLSRLYDYCNEGKFTDIELTSCDRRQFKVHSIVLLATSDFFHGLHRVTNYHFDCIHSETLNHIIRYCYTGQIRLTTNNIKAIIFAAHELKIKPLKLVCSKFLDSSLNVDNCLQYALIAEKCALKSSKELAQKCFIIICSKLYKQTDFQHRTSFQLTDLIEKLTKNQIELFDGLVQQFQSNEQIKLLPESFGKDLFQAICRSFFAAGYIQSLKNTPEPPPTLNRSTSIAPVKSIIETEISDEGLYIVAKNKSGTGVEFYSFLDLDHSRLCLLKYRINTDGINLFSLKLFPHKERIYVSYLTRNQRLEIKSWHFKSQTMTDVLLPTTMQYLKPRLTNAVTDTFLVTEEKYVAWPYEGYKTTACKFGLKSECYRAIEFNYDSLKEAICIGDDVYGFSNEKSEVVSFDMNTGKRTFRGVINNDGVIKAVVYRDILYVGSYVRSKCTLFVEQFNKKMNQWITVGSICTYTDASNYHIGATDNYLYVFYGIGKVQRYNEATGKWATLDFMDNFDQMVLCVSSTPFTCISNKKF